jgi:DedD protein
MARTISDEELQLKRRARRRLIGAIVLVAAIVVVLPMVLDSEPRPAGQAVSVQIPSPDSGAFAPKAPLPEAPEPAAPKKAPDQPPAVKEPQKMTATPPPAKEAPQPVVKVEPAKPAVAKPAARPGGQHVVQVIALADAVRAKQMQQTIAAAGIKSYTEVVKTAKGDVTRVRAGPFASRADAEKAREQLKALGMNGNITTR